jgi:hypothetical protein
MANKSMSKRDACLALTTGTTIQFDYKGKTYEICITRPFENNQKKSRPVRFEPVMRSRKYSKSGIVISSIEIVFAGENGDTEISSVSFKIRGSNERIQIPVNTITIQDPKTLKPIRLVQHLEQVSPSSEGLN